MTVHLARSCGALVSMRIDTDLFFDGLDPVAKAHRYARECGALIVQSFGVLDIAVHVAMPSGNPSVFVLVRENEGLRWDRAEEL